MKTLIIYGPTSSGKTSLALALAKKHGGEIISADSRQVYKGLDIGSGKVDFKNAVAKHNNYWIVDGIRIHGFDLVEPGQSFTVSDFIKFAGVTIKKIEEAGKLPIIAGGTAFYLYSLINGLNTNGIGPDKKLRNQLEKLPREQLYLKLFKLNKEKALSMNQSDRLNPRRLIRAIEISSSNPPSFKKDTHLLGNCQTIGLTATNSYLFQRSDIWLDERIKHGLIEEVDGLIKNKTDIVWLEKLGLEYRWITLFVTGKLSFGEAASGLKGDTHDYIRRQKSWFKKFVGMKLYNVADNQYLIPLDKEHHK